MKILAIHFRNLNSLAGSWSIDFTSPEYADAGIFAITGPTGAGKSTILDAICLALFARTPRLGHISKSSNEIMSRRAGDCFAEVTFETSHGVYRCHWGQHRARRSAEGELQAPKHELVDGRTNQVLETRSKEVSRLVEQLTGMDYDRFTRSMLLAQGDFAAFLEADADQRAPILEQITGTVIYSQISIAVHERASEERRKTAALQEAMGQIELLGAEEEQALAARIAEDAAAVTDRQQQLAVVNEALHRRASVESLQRQIRDVQAQQQGWSDRFAAAQAELARYERGLQAQSLVGEYTRWQHLQERIGTLHEQEKLWQDSLEVLRQEALAAAEGHARAHQQASEAVAQQRQEHEILKTVRSLDLRLQANTQAIEQKAARLQQLKEESRQQTEQRAAIDRQLATICRQQEVNAAYFHEHGSDGMLIEHLAALRRQLEQLGELDQGVAQLCRRRDEAEKAHAEATGHWERLQLAVDEASQELARLQQLQAELLADMGTLLAGQEAAVLRRAIEQAEQRLRDLIRLDTLLAQQEALLSEQEAALNLLQELRQKQQQCDNQLQAFVDRRQIQLRLVAELERSQQLALQIRSYEEQRRHLVAGSPCPLCGAVEHPWSEQRPSGEEPKEALAQAQDELLCLDREIVGCREQRVGLVKDIAYAVDGRATRDRQLVELAAQLAELQVILADGPAEEKGNQLRVILRHTQEELADSRQRLEAVERLERQLSRLGQQREQAQAKQIGLLGQVQAAAHAKETALHTLRQLAEQVQAQRQLLDHCLADITRQVEPLGISECSAAKAKQLAAELEKRQQLWKAQQRKGEQLVEDRAKQEAEREKVTLQLAATSQALATESAAMEALQREGAVVQAERLQLFGNRDPDEEERRRRLVVEQAQAAEATARNRCIALEKQEHALLEQLRVSREERDALGPQRQTLESHFLAQLAAADFPDVAAFRSAMLSPENLEELGRLQEALAKERTVLATRLTEYAEALQRELAKGEIVQETAELLAEQRRLNQELEALQQRIGADRERLAGNVQRKQQFEGQQQMLAAQQKELERWTLLHQLIGSADGKKFRVFAQGLTFDVMISHANRQLRTMNDRYILLRDTREPLALQVIDNYQAGEIRSTRNLSGGESFLVSLALSLGLSAMASHNVRVDSLFLDEGFGTLDEEALDTALQTLSELRREGKLIGIISHVPQLKDRIDIQIQVAPGTGGCSRLVGPGCRQEA